MLGEIVRCRSPWGEDTFFICKDGKTLDLSAAIHMKYLTPMIYFFLVCMYSSYTKLWYSDSF